MPGIKRQAPVASHLVTTGPGRGGLGAAGEGRCVQGSAVVGRDVEELAVVGREAQGYAVVELVETAGLELTVGGLFVVGSVGFCVQGYSRVEVPGGEGTRAD